MDTHLDLTDAESRSWKVSGLPDFEFLWDRCPSSFPHHLHEGFNIDFVQSGVLEYRIGVHTLVAHPGDLIWIDRHEVHEARPVSDQTIVRSLFLSESYVSSLASHLKMSSVHRSVYPIIQDDELSKQIGLIHRAAEKPLDTLEIESRLGEMISSILSRHVSMDPHSKPDSTEHTAVTRIKDYILAHYDENITLKELSDLVDLNASYLVRLFRNHVGLPPYGYLTQIRMARARNLLADGMTPANVAATVGLSDQSHLTRIFKRNTGMTPGSYARSQFVI